MVAAIAPQGRYQVANRNQDQKLGSYAEFHSASLAVLAARGLNDNRMNSPEYQEADRRLNSKIGMVVLVSNKRVRYASSCLSVEVVKKTRSDTDINSAFREYIDAVREQLKL